jgi:hypothetical protein
MLKVIWIDQNIDNSENKKYINELKLFNALIIKLYKSLSEAMNYMMEIKFEEIKIIISGKIFSKLVQKFKKNAICSKNYSFHKK